MDRAPSDRPRTARLQHWLRRELPPLALTIALLVLARSSFANHYQVPSGSMMPALLPGDRVDVVLTRDLASGAAIEGAGRSRLVSDIVLQNVRVLGMDLNVDPATAKPAIAHTATLEVSAEDAELYLDDALAKGVLKPAKEAKKKA